jgi:hypothetical protein
MKLNNPYFKINRRWMLITFILILGVLAWPSGKTTGQQADRMVQDWQTNQLQLSNTPQRNRLISVFKHLERDGEERRMAQLGPIFLDPHFTKEELQSVATAAFSLFDRWNDAPAAWRWNLYLKLMSFPGSHLEGPYCALHNEFTPVQIQFHTGKDYRELYLAGNWTASGRLAQFRGYHPLKFVNQGNGLWTLRVPLQRSPFSHAYHAVVRTAPWPAGDAIGWTTFRLYGEHSKVIDIPEQLAVVPHRAAYPRVQRKSHLLLVGIDGASWHILLPWIQRGVLPNWSRLLQEGTVVRLTADGGRFAYSSLPSIHTALTGYVPARHQTKKEFFGFSIRPTIPRIWNVASDQGLQVGTVGVWGTFPVEKIHGAMVSEAFFFIRALDNPLLKEILYSPWTVNFAESFGVQAKDFDRLLRFAHWVKPYVETTYPAALEHPLQALLPPLALSTQSDIATLTWLTYDECIYYVTRYLLDQHPYDLIVNYLIDVDSRSHISWQEFEPLGRTRIPSADTSDDALLRSYQRTDRYLGDMMNRFDQIVLFSDHGMGSIPSDHYHPFIHLEADKLAAVYKKMNPERPSIPYTLTQLNKYDYRLESPSSEAALTPLVEFLKGGTVVSTGDPLFEVTSYGPGSSTQQFLVRIRARFDRMEDRIHLGKRDFGLSDLFLVRAIAADHVGNGIMALWGKGIRPGIQIEDAYEEDVAATAMYLLDLPISSPMDGRPLMQAIQDDYQAAHPVRKTSQVTAPPQSVISILRSIRWKRLMHFELWRKLPA